MESLLTATNAMATGGPKRKSARDVEEKGAGRYPIDQQTSILLKTIIHE
jgi:hypothetical protein